MTQVIASFIFLLLVLIALPAHARPPEGKAEGSLLYWRYLCRGGVQEEKVESHRRELKCLSQSWSVVGPEALGQVEEIRTLGK